MKLKSKLKRALKVGKTIFKSVVLFKPLWKYPTADEDSALHEIKQIKDRLHRHLKVSSKASSLLSKYNVNNMISRELFRKQPKRPCGYQLPCLGTKQNRSASFH